MEVKCINYYNDWWPGKNTLYTVQIQNKTITSRDITLKGDHKPDQSDLTVKGVRFDDCDMTLIPDGIMTRYPNMQIFLVFNAKITRLTKDDLKQFTGIRELWFSSCDIEYLPGDLFEHLPDLEIVSFQTCKVKYIDAELLDCLPNLKVAKFNSNASIDCYHDSVSSISGNAGITLDELKEKLRGAKLRAPEGYETYDRLPKGITADLKTFLARDDFKDFTVTVDDEDFRVHRFMLVARSRVFAEMIKESPEAQQLTLVDVDRDIFEVLLRFIYDDVMPDVTTKGFEIFKGANRLGLDRVAAYAIRNMSLSVNEDNALDMLICGRRYGNCELKDNAMVEIRKMFPGKEVKDELANDTEKLSKVMVAKKKMDEAIKKAQEEFEKMNFFD
jgi:hypothetical protein